MSLPDIFYSPALRPFRRSKYNGVMAVRIQYRMSRIDEPEECLYLARSMGELTAKIRELNRVQSAMGLRIGISHEQADRTRAFLAYSPLPGPFMIEGDAFVRDSGGVRIPVRQKRWIAHPIRNFEF